jgi:hypothetical protein
MWSAFGKAPTWSGRMPLEAVRHFNYRQVWYGEPEGSLNFVTEAKKRRPLIPIGGPARITLLEVAM